MSTILEFIPYIEMLSRHLVNKEYVKLEKEGYLFGDRHNFEDVVNSYPYTLGYLPKDFPDYTTTYPILNDDFSDVDDEYLDSAISQYRLDMNSESVWEVAQELWTLEEGWVGLSLFIEFTVANREIKAIIHDLRVP